jgi:4-hydroxybenzoate polyprenyltransferase
MPVTSPAVTGARRWVTYQRERFPLVAHGILILAFSGGAVAFASQLRAAGGVGDARPSAPAVVVAFVSCLLFFLQLRVADEFKDFEEDSRWRPYRPVPRGLVTLRELGWVAAGSAVVQLLLALWLSPRLLIPLAVVWGYMALMSREFLAAQWLRKRPVTVLWTHMLVIPLIDLYATSCDWLVAADGPKAIGAGLYWFLAASFFNGMVVEVGRKIRAPEDEEPGVETYSALWGRRRAVTVWLAMMVATLGCAVAAGAAIGAGTLVGGILGVLLLAGASIGHRMATAPRPGAGRTIETVAGIWTIAMYASVGLLPLVIG